MAKQTPDSADERLREEQNNAAGAPQASCGPTRWVGPQLARGPPAASDPLPSGGVGPQLARGVPPVAGRAAPGGLSRPATDLAAASEQLLSGGGRPLDSAPLRNALRRLHGVW